MQTSISGQSEFTQAWMKFIPAGDSALIAKAGNDISEISNRRIQNMLLEIDSKQIQGIVELVPAFNELLIYFDCRITNHKILIDQLKKLNFDFPDGALTERNIVHIPVLYGGQFGPDLLWISERHNLSKSEVIDIHTSIDYPVYMLGFTPGFCYLGGVDPRIAVPRLETPRASVNAGSVGIAGTQTGIYPLTGPGGWQILGRTPVKIFNPHRKPYFLIKAGDFVRFYAIDETTFSTMQHEAESKSPTDAKKSSK